VSLKSSILTALMGIVLGLSIAIVFGVNEDFFKDRIDKGVRLSEEYSKVKNKDEYLKREVGKNWRYYQRFHFHSSAVGSMSVGLLLLIGFTSGSIRRKKTLGTLLSLSGILYPFVWLFAGIFGPEWGRSEAKEAFAIFGYMGGVYLATIIWTLIEVVKTKTFEFKF
jgi:hypothetical protein